MKPGFDRLGDQLVGDAVVAEDVDLEEPGAVGRGGRDLGRARGRERREAERRARGCGGPRQSLLPVRMGHPLVGDRSHDDGRATACPSTVVAVETDSIPQSTRWRRRHDANAATFSASVRSAPAPPARYSAQSGSMRAAASASTSVSVSGGSTASIISLT